MTGNPAHRPSLVDFANIITKKISILIAGHVITEQGPVRDYQTFQYLNIHTGEPGKPEGRDAEVAEGPQHQGLLLLHPDRTHSEV